MCGFLGYVLRASAPRPDLDVARRALKHRGPNDYGTFVSGSGAYACGLAHTRLSIVDLSSAGHQPMLTYGASGDVELALAFNGEIYNYRELRAELVQLGFRFVSDTDTEVILAAFQHWGPLCLERFRGMFAFAIWNARDGSLFLARDRLGVKPLYVVETADGVAFASEVRALMATGCVARKLSVAGAATYLATGSVSEPHTMIEGVHPLPPGSFLELRAGVAARRHYWHLDLDVDRLATPAEAAARVADLLDTSVRLRLRSDVPTGVFLSSGIDSAALVAVASKYSSSPLRTFTLVFEEAGFNEGPNAAEVARKFGCKHTEARISRDALVSQIESALSSMDQPTSDGVNTYVVSQAARASGLVVALSGIGADELFAGYSNFRRFAWARRVFRDASVSDGLRRLVRRAAGSPRCPPEIQKISNLLEARGEAGKTYLALRAMFTHGQVVNLLRDTSSVSRGLMAPGLARSVEAGLTLGNIDDHCAYGALDLSNYLLNTILRDSDCMSMAHSFEIREPFLDHELVEYAMRLPASVKTQGRGNKPLLTAAVPGVPQAARLRKKLGFTMPFDAWLRGPLRKVAEERLAESSLVRVGLLDAEGVGAVAGAFYGRSRGVSWSRLWSLVVLSDWCLRNRVTV